MNIQHSVKFGREALTAKRTLSNLADAVIVLIPAESIVRDGDDLTLTYFIDYDGFESQGIVRYNAAYQDDEYKSFNNYSIWDTPLVQLDSFDCMNGGIGWKLQAEMLTLMLEFNEQIIKELGVFSGPLGVTK